MTNGHNRWLRWSLVLTLGASSLEAGCGSAESEPEDVEAETTASSAPAQRAAEPLLPANFGAVRLSRGFLPDPHVVEGTSGGLEPASQRGEGCVGWITEAPDHVLEVGEPLGSLRILAWSEQDIALLVQRPDGGIVCNDDAYGTQPVIDLDTVQSGSYGIWVASYEVRANSTYRLGFSELASTRPSALVSGRTPAD